MKQAQRRLEHGRIVYYLKSASAAFWDTHWQSTQSLALYTDAEQGWLMPGLREFVELYLPEEGVILEAGCGLGQVVLALQTRGHNVEGVEWGEQTVAQVVKTRPDIRIRVGDVTALAVPDGYYTGYISLGVIEHRREGPEPFLKEAFRILKPGGVALISVPYKSPLRQLKAQLGFYNADVSGLEFYQYAFPREEIHAMYQAAGFSVMGWTAYDSFKGLKDEIALIRLAIRSRRLERLLRAINNRLSIITAAQGHMILTACQKPG